MRNTRYPLERSEETFYLCGAMCSARCEYDANEEILVTLDFVDNPSKFTVKQLRTLLTDLALLAHYLDPNPKPTK